MRSRRAVRWVVAAVAAALLGAVGVLLLRAPVPAVSGPTGAGPAGPHTHVMAGPSGAVVPVGGTATAAGGYALVVTATSPFTFHVQGPDGAPVTRFAVVHDRPLHLVVVRKDLTGYRHLHPTMAPDGTWTVPLDLPAPGPYRAYADFAALDKAGRQNAVVLGTDLPSTAPPAPRPSTVDDLAVRYEGTLTVGVAEPLLFRVTRAGAPVALQPYLGSYGHLTVVRETDLGYLHIHPDAALADGALTFWVAAPSAGTYRMFLDVQVDGVVRPATFTVTIAG
jgi:hypothetical protein